MISPETLNKSAELNGLSIELNYNSCPLASRLPRVLRNHPSSDDRQQYLQEFIDAIIRHNPSTAEEKGVKPDEARALSSLMSDVEWSSLYGIGHPGDDSKRQKQAGLRSLIAEENFTGDPVNRFAYRVEDLLRDTIQRAQSGGGNPDVLLVSNRFFSASSTWDLKVTALPIGTNKFNQPVRAFRTDAIPATIVLDLALIEFTAVALSWAELEYRGDPSIAYHPSTGLGISETVSWKTAIHVEHPSHHAWVEGIKVFAR